MRQQTFTLSPGSDFIPLDKLLKLMNVVGSGGEAHQLIADAQVLVNGAPELQKRKKIRKGDVVRVGENEVICLES